MKEDEIRPQNIFAEYLRLCEQDALTYFVDVPREEGLCPACGANGKFAFTKQGFDYACCPDCDTLYVNPRPLSEAFSRYYTESPSAKFWATTFYRETAEARREKLWKPKARMILEILERYTALDHAIIDVGGGYGLFAEEMGKISSNAITVIEPGPHLAQVCRDKSLRVIEKFLEQVGETDLPVGPRAFVSFELFEHLHAPDKFLACINQLMQPGDLFLFSTLSGTGVDIQVLWNDSNSISPPHHLNFLNPRSIKILLHRVGFESLEVTSPGKLDIDIMANNQDRIKDRFWRTFVSRASESEREQWQNLLASSGWSSHMMVTCRKPKNKRLVMETS
jgi:SAM-dependent methyltransferase